MTLIVTRLPTVNLNIKPLKTLSIALYCSINYICEDHLRNVQVKLVHVGASSAIHNIMICVIRLLDLCGSAYT